MALIRVAGRRLRRAALVLAAAGSLAGCVGPNPHYDPAKAHHTPEGFTNNDRSIVQAGKYPWSPLTRPLFLYINTTRPWNGTQ